MTRDRDGSGPVPKGPSPAKPRTARPEGIARNSISEPQFGDLIGSWHLWFAWHPVRTYDQRFVWLKPVWRRCVFKHQLLRGGGDFWWWYSLVEPAE